MSETSRGARLTRSLTLPTWWLAGGLLASVTLALVMGAIADARGVALKWQDTLPPSAAYVITWMLVLRAMIMAARRVPFESRGRRWRLVLAVVVRPVLAVVATVMQLQLHFLLTEVDFLPQTITLNRLEGGTLFFVGRLTEGIALALLVLVADALLYRARAEHTRELRDARMASPLAEARLAALTMELQPHFLFSTLNAISTLVHSDAVAADRMIAKLKTLLRHTLDAGRQPMATLADEIELVELYIDIQRIRFGSRLTATIDMRTDLQDAQVPRLQLQRRLSVTPGQELEWIEDGMGGFRVVPHTPDTAEALAVHEKIMAEYDAVFRALAK